MQLDNLANNDIVVARVNVSDFDVSTANTGSINGIQSYSTGASATAESKRPVRKHHSPISLPFKPSQERRATIKAAPTLGSTEYFWVLESIGLEVYKSIPAVLRAIGNHCYVWVATDNDGGSGDDQISVAQAASYQQMFDKLYALETNLFGYEMGGGSSGNGGLDGDKRISILILDIDFDHDYGIDSTLGYFSPVDEYTQAQLDNEGEPYKSNEREIFYIDAFYASTESELTYTTLAHEFQHMIHFAQHAKHSDDSKCSELWFNEMFSAIAEDLCAHPSIGLSYDDLIEYGGYPYYFNSYFGRVSYSTWDSPIYGNWEEDWPYAKAYMLGAYLARNYGGARLLHEISTNGYDNEDALGAALYKLYPAQFTTDYRRNASIAFARFGEALVYGNGSIPQGVHTLNKTTVSSLNGNTYYFPALNLWDYEQEVISTKGPAIPNNWNNSDIKAFGIVANRSRNVSGSHTLTFTRPKDPNILTFVIIK
jgi:hypothetical protein